MSLIRRLWALWLDLWRKHRWPIVAGGAVAVLAPVNVMVLGYAAIAPNKAFILDPSNSRAIQQKDIHVGLVLGAGVAQNGKPFRELQARLDAAADALGKGYIDKLLLSGDNRFHNYNEPQAMRDYLVHVRHLPAQKLQVDYAGRSTYESCERAAKIFGQHKLVIFSAGSHLPRAIFLCRQFGIESYGIASNVEANNSWRRELLARVKALYNIYIHGENTVLGSPISM